MHVLQSLGFLCVMLLLTACGGTRIALPISLNQAIDGVPKSGVFSENDRIRWEMSDVGRERLLVEHRDADAFIKQESARSVLAFRYLSAQTSEVLIRSDDVGYLMNTRNKNREQRIARALRDWADAQIRESDYSPEE